MSVRARSPGLRRHRPLMRFLRRGLAAALLALPLLSGLTTGAQAQTTDTTFVKNTGQASVANAVVGLNGDRAQAFTTGSNAAGYKLTSVKIKFTTIVQAGSHNRITVAIHTDSSGSPGSSVGTLTVPTLPNGTDKTIFTFTASGQGIDLTANTQYWIVVDVTATNGFSSFEGFEPTTSDAEDAGAASGWSIANSYVWRTWNSSGSWTTHEDESLQIEIIGTAKMANTSTLSISGPADANEGDSGTTDRIFTVSLSSAVTEIVSYIACFGGTATQDTTSAATIPASADYQVWRTTAETQSCVLDSISPGKTTSSALPYIKVKGDTDTEPTETVVGTLSLAPGSSPAGVVLGTSMVTHRILNDDGNNPPTGAPDVNAPNGVARGQTLTAIQATLTDPDGLPSTTFPEGYAFQWQRSGTDIAGATSQTYTLVQADVNQYMSVTVSYTDLAGTVESVTTLRTGSVLNVNDTPTGAPTITGDTIPGQTLTANQGTLADPDGLPSTAFPAGYTFQWQRGGTDIAGATSQTYTLVAADAGETITVTVSYTDGEGTSESVASAATETVGIKIRFKEKTHEVDEGDAVTLTLQLSHSLAADMTILIPLTGIDASRLLDFSPGVVSVTIPSGMTEQTFDVSTIDDSLVEEDEIFVATIQENQLPTGVVLGAPATSTITIRDDETPVITVQAKTTGDASVVEGGDAAFRLFASPVPEGALSVNVRTTQSGNFVDAGDLGAGTVSIAADGSQADFDVATVNDSTAENNGSVTLTVEAGSGYRVGAPASAEIEVLDDEHSIQYRVTRDTAVEGSMHGYGIILFQYLSPPLASGETAKIPLSFSGGTLGTDFTLSINDSSAFGSASVDAMGVLTLTGPSKPGQSMSVRLLAAEDVDMADETVTVSASAGTVGTGALVPSRDGNGQITLLDNDVAQNLTVEFTLGAYSVNEDEGLQESVVRLSEMPRADKDIPITVTEGTATRGVDFESDAELTITVLAGSLTGSVQFTIPNDDLDEPDETYTLAIDTDSLPAGVTAKPGGNHQVTVTIQDDDNTAPTGAPAIAGTAAVGETLTANRGTLADADGLPSTTFPEGYTFQWKRGTTNIAGATSRTYTLVAADAGQTITVAVSYTDGFGNAETVASAATAAIDGGTTEHTLTLSLASGEPSTVDEGDDPVELVIRGTPALGDYGLFVTLGLGGTANSADYTLEYEVNPGDWHAIAAAATPRFDMNALPAKLRVTALDDGAAEGSETITVTLGETPDRYQFGYSCPITPEDPALGCIDENGVDQSVPPPNTYVVGTSASVSLTIRPSDAPAKPAGFSATAGRGAVSLSWSDPGNSGISGWQYQQKAGNNAYGSWRAISGSNASTTSHTVTGLSNGTAYTFRIRAVAGTVNGAPSDEAAATPEAAPGIFWRNIIADTVEDAGTHNEPLLVNRALASALTVNYSLSGTATCGADYTITGADCTAGTGAFTLPANTPAFTDILFPITITEDDIADNGETIIMTLTANDDYNLLSGTMMTVTIREDTGTAAFSLSGMPQVGETLAIVKDSDDPEGNGSGFSYIWNFRATSADAWNPASMGRNRGCLIGATTCTPTHSEEHPTVGGYFRGEVGYFDGNGLATTVYTNIIGPFTLPPPGIVLPTADLALREGGTASYNVKLATDPGDGATVRVSVTSGDAGAVAVNDTQSGEDGIQNHLDFSGGSGGSWNTHQAVTVRGLQDADATSEADVALIHAVSVQAGTSAPYTGLADRILNVDVRDDDAPNSAPAFASATLTRSVAENAAAGANVGAAIPAATDRDGDALAYTLGGADADSFQFDGATRQITTRDGVAYDNEVKSTYTVTVTSDDNNGGTATVRVTITVLDAEEPAASFAAAVSSAGEDAGTRNVQVNLSLAPQSALTLSYAVGGTATADADFSIANSGSARVSANAASVSIPVAITDDAEDEEAETVILTLTAGDGYTLGSTSVHTLIINDNDEPPPPPPSVTPVVNFGAASSSANEDAGAQNVAVSLSPAPQSALTLSYTVGGTAAEGADFTIANSGSARVSANAASVNIPVTITDDTADEGDETVVLTLMAGDGYTLGSGSIHTLTINDNDEPPPPPPPPSVTPVVNFGAASSSANEDAGAQNVAVSLSPAPQSGLTLSYTVGGTAAEGADFSIANSGSARVSANAASVNIPVAITDDTADESAETVILTLTAGSGSGYELGSGNNVHTLTINDNDEPPTVITPTVSISAGAAVAEGGAANFTLTASPAPAADIAVQVTVSGGGFAADATRLVTVGATGTASFTVATDDDATDEPDGSVSAMVDAGAGYAPSAANASASVAVMDNDEAGVEVSAVSGSAEEGGASASYTVVLGSEPTADVVVTAMVSDGGRVEVGGGAGASGASAALTFTPSNWNQAQTVTVSAIDDAIAQGDETVQVSHSAASADASYSGIAVSGVSVAVADNDEAGVEVSAVSGSAEEGGSSASYTVVLGSEPLADVVVTAMAPEGGRIELGGGAGASGTSAALTFTPSNWDEAQTVTVTAVDDSIPQGDSTASISHSAASSDRSYVGIAIAAVSVRVVNDDDPPPVVSGSLAAVSLEAGGSAAEVDLSAVFSGEGLSYRASSSDASVAAVSLSGAQLSVAPVREGAATVAVTASNASGMAEASFEVRVSRSAAETAAIESALGSQARMLLNSATDVIGERFHARAAGEGEAAGADEAAGSRLMAFIASAFGGSGGGGGCVALGGYGAGIHGASDGLADAPAALAGGQAQWGASCAAGAPNGYDAGALGADVFGAGALPSLDGLASAGSGASAGFNLRDRSLALPLNGGGSAGGIGWTLWAAGDFQSLSGGEAARYDGEQSTAYLGVDAAFGGGGLAGLAVSRSQGEMEYALDALAGHIETELTSVYPYLRFGADGGTEFWAVGGFGRGDASAWRGQLGAAAQPAGGAAEADAEFSLGAAGIRWPLLKLGGAEWSFLGDAGYAELSLESSEGMLSGYEPASASRARAGLEASFGGETARSFVRLSGRYDGGGGLEGGGAELAAGLRFASGRVSGELKGRWLRGFLRGFSGSVAEETGLSALLNVAAREDGTGLSLSIAPGWGLADAGAFGLWDAQRLRQASGGIISRNMGLALDSRLAWGLRLKGGAMLSPFARYRSSGGLGRNASLGLAVDGAIRMELALARRWTIKEAPGNTIELNFSFAP